MISELGTYKSGNKKTFESETYLKNVFEKGIGKSSDYC